MHLVIEPAGGIRCLYGETIDLHLLGRPIIRRGSHVEPAEDGTWLCNLSPVSGPVLGPFALRSQALAAETAWLDEHWLAPGA
jgi:hypothetical protein